MEQHICLFYLGDKLDFKKQQEFFYRLSTALGYDEKTFSAYYILYSTQYQLFDGKSMTPDTYKNLIRLSKCDSCKKLCQKFMYKDFDIPHNACILCKHSEFYRNARIHSEQNVLRSLLEPGGGFKPYFINAESAFMSIHRIGEDYAIGSKPILSLHAYMYSFLSSRNGVAASETQDDVVNAFLEYLKNTGKLDITLLSQPDTEVHIKRFIKSIYRIDISGLEPDYLAKEVLCLQEVYRYQVSSPVARAKTGKRVPSKQDDSQLDLFSACKNLQIEIEKQGRVKLLPGEPAEESKIQSEHIVEEAEPLSTVKEPDSYENELSGKPAVEIAPECTSPMYENTNKEQTPAAEQEPVRSVVELANTSIADSSSCGTILPATSIETNGSGQQDEEKSIEIQDDVPDTPLLNEDTQNKENTDTGDLFFTDSIVYSNVLQYIKIYPDYITAHRDTYLLTDEIIATFDTPVTCMSRHHSYDFTTSVLKSSYISLLPVLYHERKGFLIYTEYSNQLYHFDVEVYGTTMLTDLLTDHTVITYTLHTCACVSIFKASGSQFTDFIPLDLLFRDKENAHFQSLTDTVSALPKYPDMYHAWFKKKEKSNRELTFARRTILALNELFADESTEWLFSEMPISFSLEDSFVPRFHYRYGLAPSQPGYLYQIKVPGAVIHNLLSADDLLSDILLLKASLPHSYRAKTSLLYADYGELAIYFRGNSTQADRFYDLFLSGLQRIYAKHFGRPLQSVTKCTVYEI